MSLLDLLLASLLKILDVLLLPQTVPIHGHAIFGEDLCALFVRFRRRGVDLGHSGSFLLRPLRDTEESGPPVPKFSGLQGVLGLAMSIASTWDEVGLKIGDGSTVQLRRLGAMPAILFRTGALGLEDLREISDRLTLS